MSSDLEISEPDTKEDEVSRYFEALGGGSRDDMQDPPDEDDDAKFEKHVEVRELCFPESG